MSTQPSSSEIPLTVSEPQQNLRLVELPPELLDLLSAPRAPRLYFKSSSPRTSNQESLLSSPASKAAEQLHLCTANQSYQVRQVSTSNSVYVIEPSVVRAASGDGDEATGLGLAPARGSEAMTAIAKVDTMLELLPVSLDARLMLERVLPIYDASEGWSAEEATSHFRSHSTAASKSALFADIPAPDSQIEQAWRDLLAFDFKGRCARPGAATLLSAWKSIIDYSTLEQLDLTGDVNFKGFFQTEQASPTDASVAEAILLSLQDRSLPNSTAHSLHLDRGKVVSWVGRTLLQARSEKPGSKPLRTEDYVSQWQDLLPESQREDAKLHKLPEACYAIGVGEGKGTILWRGLDDAGSGPAQTAIAGATKATSGKRKWHEKFKAQRKEIKK